MRRRAEQAEHEATVEARNSVATSYHLPSYQMSWQALQDVGMPADAAGYQTQPSSNPAGVFGPGMHQNASFSNAKQGYVVPLPKMLFDGKASWKGFIQPFLSTAQTCNWNDEEKLLGLRNSLRGAAAEFAFEQLPPAVLDSFSALCGALEMRFVDRRTTTSYLAELENRKLGVSEKLPEYVADIKRLVLKGYPTADPKTLETIGLRYKCTSNKGIPDQKTSLAVGMRDPKSIEEAVQALETYRSLKEDPQGQGKAPKVRAVQTGQTPDKRQAKYGENRFVTESRLKEFGKEMTTVVENRMDKLTDLIQGINRRGVQAGAPRNERSSNSTGGTAQRDKRNVECFKCHELGHFARECPQYEHASRANETGINSEASTGAEDETQVKMPVN